MALPNSTWLVALAFVFSFLMALMHGANDVANSFGTSVGSGVISLNHAVLLAGVFSFLGAILLGGAVTETIRKGVVDLDAFNTTGDPDEGAQELMLVNLCTLIGASAYLGICTYLRMPVSATQAVLGGLVGATMAYSGASAVQWIDDPVCYISDTNQFKCEGIFGIVLQWFISPVIAMAFACTVFYFSRSILLRATDDQVRRRAPSYIALVFGIVMFAVVWFVVCQSENFPGGYGWDPAEIDAAYSPLEIMFCFFMLFATAFVLQTIFLQRPDLLYRDFRRANVLGDDNRKDAEEGLLQQDNSNIPDQRPRKDSDGERAAALLVESAGPFDQKDKSVENAHANSAKFNALAEKAFSLAQIFSACLGAFSHGANDVSNEVAPFAAVYITWQKATIDSENDVPLWIYAYAGLAISIGLALFGRRVMQTVGRDLTLVTPGRGFNIELGYALASLVASAMGWPVSTTQLAIGAVVGVGLMSGEGSGQTVNLKLLVKVFSAWVLTPIGSGLFSAAAYGMLFKALEHN